MMPAIKIATDRFCLVAGLGETGWSVVRYLAKKQLPFAVVDTRASLFYVYSLWQYLPASHSFFGVAFMVKGSRGMKMEEVVNFLRQKLGEVH